MTTRLQQTVRNSLETQQMDAAAVSDVEIDEAQVAQFLDEKEDQHETILDALFGIEAVYDTIREYSGQALEKPAASFMHVAMENHMSRLGLDPTALPALETFSGKRAQLATTLTTESVAETLEKAWDTLKAFLKRLLEQVQAFLKSYLSHSGRLLKRARDLKAAAQKASGAPKIEDIDDLATVSDKVSLGGSLPTDVPAVVKALGKFQRAGFELSATARHASEDELELFLNTIGSSRVVDSAAMVDSLMRKPMIVPSIFSDRVGGEDGVATPYLPGDVRFVIWKSPLSTTSNLFTYRLQVELNGSEDKDRDTRLPTLSLQVIERTAGEMIDVISEHITLSEKCEREMSDIQKKIDSARFGAATDADPFTNRAVRSLLTRVVQNRLLLSQQAAIRTSVYCLQSSQAFLKWAERSLDEYAEAA